MTSSTTTMMNNNTVNDWTSIISAGSPSNQDEIIIADDFLDVHFLGDDLLDIYGDAIDEANEQQQQQQQQVNQQYSHQTMIVSDEIPILANNDSILNGFASLVNPPPTIVESDAFDKSSSWVHSSLLEQQHVPIKTGKRKSIDAAAAADNNNNKKKRVTPPKKEAKKIPQTPTLAPKPLQQQLPTSPTFTLTVSLPCSTLQSAGTADDEFKVHAQAAVTEFLEKNHQEQQDKVDTTTEHVKALTADNWVAGGGNNTPTTTDVCSLSENDCCSESNNKLPRNRRSEMNAEDRAKQNRDRNREHARNTRLRKKAYVDELKSTLLQVVAQRDAAALAKQHAAMRDQEQRDVRYRVVQEFMTLRGAHVKDVARWSAILEDDFCLTLPSTPYRRMVQSNSVCGSSIGSKQVITGVAECMSDASNLSSFLQSLGSHGGDDCPVTLQYKCDRQAFLMDGASAMVDWEAEAVGAAATTTFAGFVRCTFSPVTNKLRAVNMFFDTGVVTTKINSVAVTVAGSASSAASISKEEDSSFEEEQSVQDEETAGRVPSTIELSSPEFH